MNLSWRGFFFPPCVKCQQAEHAFLREEEIPRRFADQLVYLFCSLFPFNYAQMRQLEDKTTASLLGVISHPTWGCCALYHGNTVRSGVKIISMEFNLWRYFSPSVFITFTISHQFCFKNSYWLEKDIFLFVFYLLHLLCFVFNILDLF